MHASAEKAEHMKLNRARPCPRRETQDPQQRSPAGEQKDWWPLSIHFPLCFLPGDLCAAESAAWSWSGSAARRRNGGGRSLLRVFGKQISESQGFSSCKRMLIIGLRLGYDSLYGLTLDVTKIWYQG